MSSHRRLLQSLACFVLLGLVAAACGGTSETASADAEVPPSLASIEDNPMTEPEAAPDKIVVAARASIDASPLWVADSQDYFLAKNLDVEFSPGPDEASLFDSLKDGRAHVAVVSVSSAVRRAMFDGDELEFITYLDGTQAANGDERGTMSLIANSTSIATGCDLEDKSVGVDSIYSLGAVSVRQMVDQDGCSPATVNFVLGDPSAHLESLDAGALDAVATTDPYTSRSLRSGAVIVANLDNELCPEQVRCPITMVVAERAWAEANPEVVGRFQKALDAAMFWIRRDELSYRAELVSCCALTADDASEILVPDFVGERRLLEADLPPLQAILLSQGQALAHDLEEELTR